MASPSLVRTAATVSIITTGAASYYFLSDGGDPEKLDERLRDIRAKLNTTIKSARNWAAAVAGSVQTQVVGGRDDGSLLNGGEGAIGSNVERMGQVKDGNAEKSMGKQERDTSGYCHTCSGPRIWFFAEKLRLKRRFTPYPDPPRE